MEKETTKRCKCGNTRLVLLRTHNKKICTDCGEELPWHLSEGQPGVGYSNPND